MSRDSRGFRGLNIQKTHLLTKEIFKSYDFAELFQAHSCKEQLLIII